jgi:amidase
LATFPEYENHDAVGLADLIRRRQISAGDVVAAAIERIERHNPAVNAVVTKTYNRALAAVEQGLPEGPFTGVPFLLKDLGHAWKGVPLTNGSRSTRWFVPDYTSTLVERYERSGLVILGKTNVPEFGLSAVTEPELHGVTANPWNLGVTAGGSSGGAAAAVAAGMVPVAAASDGAGSIRIPASHCGLFGLKPTRARTPVGPIVGEAWFGLSVGHVVGRSVRDSAAFLDATLGPEPGDPYAVPPPAGPYTAEVGRPPGRLRVGVVPGGILHDRVHPECREATRDAAALLTDLGHHVEQVEIPLDRDRMPWWLAVLAAAQTADTVAVTAALVGKAAPEPGDYELSTWVAALAGQKLGASELAAALRETKAAGRVVGRLMQQFDVLVSSTMAAPPMPHGSLQPSPTERRLLEAARRAPARAALLTALRRAAPRMIDSVPNTPLFNLTGQPAMSVPLHWTRDGLPVGVQVAARFGDEATLFRLAAQLEEARPWFHRRPPTS